MAPPDSSSTAVFRKAILAILFIGFTGTWIELLLLHHTDGFWQMVPVAMTAVAAALVVWVWLSPTVVPLRTLQVLSLALLVSGVVGVVQHFLGNMGYERESNPGLAGAELYRLSAMGSTPLLAPGIMLQLGLLGLLYTFRHPSLAAAGEAPSSTSLRKEA